MKLCFSPVLKRRPPLELQGMTNARTPLVSPTAVVNSTAHICKRVISIIEDAECGESKPNRRTSLARRSSEDSILLSKGSKSYREDLRGSLRSLESTGSMSYREELLSDSMSSLECALAQLDLDFGDDSDSDESTDELEETKSS